MLKAFTEQPFDPIMLHDITSETVRALPTGLCVESASAEAS